MSQTFPLRHLIESTQQVVRPKLRLPNQDSEWIAWWYSGIRKNEVANSQPLALVGFRELRSGHLSEKVTFRNVPLTALGQMRLGTIWKNDISRSRLRFAEKSFDVSFLEGEWKRSSFKTSTPFPHKEIHPLAYPRDENQSLEFQLENGGKLVIPCVEFFTRCYGHSAELRRILLTYGWEEAKRRFYLPLGEPEEVEVKWKVNLTKRMRNADTVFLAHMKYDPYTTLRAKEINSQLQADFVTPDKLLFLGVDPWYQGPAVISCQGIPFDNGRSFLALRVRGASDPDGILIERDRENSCLRTDDGTGELDREAWSGTLLKRLIRPPDIVSLTSDQEPDHGSSEVEILDEPFITLGIPRAIVDRRGRRVTERNGNSISGKESSSYSTGEAFGTGKGVGHADLHAPVVVESQGAIRDVWNAMCHLQREHPNRIQAVEWFTFEDGYRTDSDVQMIALEAFDEDTNVETDIRNWVFKNVKAKQLRGVFVARMLVNGVQIHIVEMDRRPRIKKDSSAQEVDSEESYRGLAINFDKDASFLTWLKRFLSDIRYVTGRVHKVLHAVPGVAHAFNHPTDKPEHVPGEAGVLNALSKFKLAL